MTKFWELVADSIIVQAVVTLMLISTLSYLYVAGLPVPEQLTNLVMIVLGFWFGTKTQHQVQRTILSLKN